MVQKPLNWSRLACLVSMTLLALTAQLAWGQLVQPATGTTSETSLAPQLASLEASEGFQRLITSIVRENIPHEFEKRDGWGETRERWDGLKIWRDGFQIKTKRRKKEVKHGSWKMYRVQLVDPVEHFQIRLESIRTLPDARTEFIVCVDAKLKAFGRFAQWEHGVQLIALSANARADVRFRATCNLGSSLDPSRFPPDVVLDPIVTQAELKLVKYRLERVSQLGGSLANELGKALREVLEDQVAKQRHKLPEKINKQIEKNRDKMRFSISDVIGSQWGGLAKSYLGVGQTDDEASTVQDTTSEPAVTNPSEPSG